MPLSSQNHGTCYVSVGVNPFQFDSSQSAWYEDICTQTPIALRPTKVSWKRCFIKPVTYFGPIVYSNMTSNIGSICSNSTVTSTDYMTTDNGSAGGPETTGNELETTTYHITTVTTVTETPVQATTTAPTETTQPPGIETIPPAETTIQTTQTTIPQPVETTTLTPQTTMPTTETTTRVTEPTIPPQAESTTQTTQTTISPPTETTTRATGTTIPLAAKTTTSFIETTKRETTQSGTTTGLDTEHTTYLAQSIAECVCACTENQNLTLIDKISNLKQDTMINKEATTAHSRARQSASDDRPTAQGLGVVMGVGLITVVVILVSLGDIITLSHLIIKNLIK
ncbi:salivary glue protein Sgs-3-like [Argopecten irradians]|uniref:salivary glue protein Sgs-3-like n=1 Tax=Argopecten irradians TaxID=31199 RepID=UPI0037107622